MSQKGMYGSVFVVNSLYQLAVYQHVDGFAGAAPMRRRIESQHLISFFHHGFDITVEIDYAGLKAMQDQQLFFGRMVPPVTTDGIAVKCKMKFLGFFKYGWQFFFVAVLRRTEKHKCLFGSFSFGEGGKKFKFCSD